jgi:serine/threonine protein kinase
MGEVYRARDSKLGRDVAIKVLPRAFHSDPERLARCEREARLLASLNHPHIGAIYGLEQVDGVHGLVFELVEGPTLADRIASGPLSINEAVPIARQISEALEAAHEQGIIHRDVAPEVAEHENDHGREEPNGIQRRSGDNRRDRPVGTLQKSHSSRVSGGGVRHARRG